MFFNFQLDFWGQLSLKSYKTGNRFSFLITTDALK